MRFCEPIGFYHEASTQLTGCSVQIRLDHLPTTLVLGSIERYDVPAFAPDDTTEVERIVDRFEDKTLVGYIHQERDTPRNTPSYTSACRITSPIVVVAVGTIPSEVALVAGLFVWEFVVGHDRPGVGLAGVFKFFDARLKPDHCRGDIDTVEFKF